MERDTHKRDGGFTLLELMVVVLIIGILMTIAVPVYGQTRQNARRRACFANQRVITQAVVQWAARNSGDVSMIAGPIMGGHPLISQDILYRPPTCPAAGKPANPAAPTLAEGAYTIQADANVAPCGFAGHGNFMQ